MAPSHECYSDITPTRVFVSNVMHYESRSALQYTSNVGYIKPKKVETKKQRITRVAKEKMLASWKLKNQKKEKVFETIQLCKPKNIMKFYKPR